MKCTDGHTPRPAWISRDAAARELGRDVSTLRNYEIEMALGDLLGGNWTVIGPCPFNGRFCSSDGEQAPDGATVIR